MKNRESVEKKVTQPSIAIIILTFNEELHIARSLDSIASLASQVFVVDSFSSDATVAIAVEKGATVLTHAFRNYASQFSWALENAPITSEWVMRLDADEIIEQDLRREIIEKLMSLPPEVTGINFKRKTIFMGKWIKHGGRYPLTLLRLWRRGCAEIEDRWMDEHMVLNSGRSITFKGGFSDWNLKNLGYFTDKHNRYATREAIDVILKKHGFDIGVEIRPGTTALQAVGKRVLKDGLYNQLPFQIGALLYFLYRYIFRLGFLDGREGAIYHFLQAFWYRFLVGAKTLELEAALKHVPDSEVISVLSTLTGYNVHSDTSSPSQSS